MFCKRVIRRVDLFKRSRNSRNKRFGCRKLPVFWVIFFLMFSCVSYVHHIQCNSENERHKSKGKKSKGNRGQPCNSRNKKHEKRKQWENENKQKINGQKPKKSQNWEGTGKHDISDREAEQGEKTAEKQCNSANKNKTGKTQTAATRTGNTENTFLLEECFLSCQFFFFF